jgi:cell division protein FtsW (lipid II flippase)
MNLNSRVLLFPIILVIALTALGLSIATAFFFPKASESREVEVARLLHLQPLPAPELIYSPQLFCSEWTGLSTDVIDCRNGLNLDDLMTVDGPDKVEAWSRSIQYAHQMLGRYDLLSSQLMSLDVSDLTQGLQLVLQQKTEAWQERLAKISGIDVSQAGPKDYAQLFALLIDLEGTSYEASSNRFRRINWHVARLTDFEPAVIPRARYLEQVLSALPWMVGSLCAVLMFLGWWRARITGLLLLAGYCVITWVGLLIAADASVHFGDSSIVFLLNPFGNQIARQFQVLWIGAGLICTTAMIAPHLGSWLRWPLHHLWLTMLLFLSAVVAAYVWLGPAMGSETLKISMAMMAGLFTAAHGRSIYLASQIAPQSLTVTRIARFRKIDATQPVTAQDLISSRLGKPGFELAISCGLGLAMAALVFHDLGASLVTAIVATCALFMLMGARLTGAVILLMSLVAMVLGQTGKVQDRIALMLDPMNASVSDFARLMAFSGVVKDKGFGLGQMAWCNSGGVCVPIQSLSDYMPIILGGLWGFKATVFYFSGFILLLIWMGRAMMREYLTRQGDVRTVAIITLYLLVCVGAQTMITFLGNWRIIPLTGIGAPLLSIGLSSYLAPCLSLGLFLAVRGWSSKESLATGSR